MERVSLNAMILAIDTLAKFSSNGMKIQGMFDIFIGRPSNEDLTTGGQRSIGLTSADLLNADFDKVPSKRRQLLDSTIMIYGGDKLDYQDFSDFLPFLLFRISVF